MGKRVSGHALGEAYGWVFETSRRFEIKCHGGMRCPSRERIFQAEDDDRGNVWASASSWEIVAPTRDELGIGIDDNVGVIPNEPGLHVGSLDLRWVPH